MQQALRLAPQNEQLLLLAAQNYLEWDKPEGALPLLRRAAEHHARSVSAWLHLARALERANQVGEAAEETRRPLGMCAGPEGILGRRSLGQ